ncbi:hypothetical protein CSIV_04870 [Microbacterium sp. CSI-V]|uniref:right-handed parallel beta-helix repeat-containing protein n=1 Tax=Microbacterium sp. CSI-V TaxID=1933777 RepID=UPI00097C78D4|nr:right-handed parallel beta-helix repeat-containing protein [Microbacterium sp. CSI-V]ONI65614.1 hypothetical protein CSIV_04870 [Microbacterium sp. CSI-V]
MATSIYSKPGADAKFLAAAAAPAATSRATGSVNLLEWVSSSSLPNRENGDAKPLFDQVLTDLATMYASDGRVYTAFAPAGRYAFSARLTPPTGGKFGVRGEGMGRTRFLTSASNSWLGMNQFNVGDPDFQWSDMFFEDFTIDGTAQPIGSSYVAGLKGFIMHNFRDTYFRRVKVFNTHATGFGIDYSDNVWFIECIADSCGRARATFQPDPETRFGSGSGFGIGFGQKRSEAIYIINSIARNNGASGIFGEQLGQPEAQYKAAGLFVSNVLLENNAIGMNDTGTRGTQATGVVARYNTYAGYRVGISNASEQGGIDGQVKGLTAYGNKVGVALEGNAEGTYLFDGVELYDNTGPGVEFRSTTNAWPGRHIRFRGPHIHENGGAGILGSTTNPIVGLEIRDALIHDNAGDGLSFYSPLTRPKITGRVFGNTGWALALRGSAETESPTMTLDVHGSSGGAFLKEHTITDQTGIAITGNPTTVNMPLTRPVPDSSLTNWVPTSSTLAYAASFTGVDSVDLGPHAAATATGSSPRIVSTGVAVTAGQNWTVSIYAIGPQGKSIQPAARFGTGGSAVWVAGPISRATGSVQRLSFTVQVPAGQTVMGSAVIGASGTSAWGAGDVLRATKANATRGGQLWSYIDGSQANCAWDGTAGASASTLTIPVPVAVPGFSYKFASMADGALPSPWASIVSSGTAIPAVVSGGVLTYGTGGNSPRTVWVREGDGSNGLFEATVGNPSEFWLSLVLRVTDANNFVAVDFRRSSTVSTVRLSKRVSTTLSEVAYTPSVTLAANDVIQVVPLGSSVDVRVNGASLFGGAQTIAEHTSVTKHGILLVSSAVARGESLKTLSFTPSA